MIVKAECVVTIPLVCELVPINMDLRELESLALNSYMSTTIFLHMLMNVCLRTNTGLSVGYFDNTKTHYIFDSDCTCFTVLLLLFLLSYLTRI